MTRLYSALARRNSRDGTVCLAHYAVTALVPQVYQTLNMVKGTAAGVLRLAQLPSRIVADIGSREIAPLTWPPSEILVRQLNIAEI